MYPANPFFPESLRCYYPAASGKPVLFWLIFGSFLSLVMALAVTGQVSKQFQDQDITRDGKLWMALYRNA
ncbi:hypothetical protein L210DRAFT_3561305 [Boletus edulis BED1]|uniref:Uncharacterized protein n=1 Tax=Boletus edulis BED1 TaxID=1328754 RepID=A0AAD4G989_BOLED|nr:hypothetical protein L210DRAFT_3561305 [Boletus edulis BED1]